MIDRVPTPYDAKIYTEDWRAWRDPEIPEWVDPIGILIGRHLGTPVERKPALIVDGKATSYGALAALVGKTAAGLAALGIDAEHRVLLFGTDGLDYMAMWFGTIAAGAVPAVVSDLYRTKDFLYFLRDTGARHLFIDAEQLPKLLDILDALPDCLQSVIVRGDWPETLAGRLSGRTLVSFDGVLRAAASAITPRLRHANDVTYMFYSGGTTGMAKGITHLAHDFVVIPERHGHFWEYRESDVVLATSKKYFTHGLWPGLLIPLYWGATAVLDRRPPQPQVVLDGLSEFAVTKLISVPTVLKNILEHLRQTGGKPSLPALSLVISASEKIPPEIFRRFFDLFGVEIFDSIGSSEVTYEWISNRPKEFKRGSLGKPIFGCEVRLVGADGCDVTRPGVAGEAWIKSRTACFFYWRKYDLSRDTFIGPWTRTGDNLYFDKDGYFWFSGRGNDVFKVKGMWVSPLEIEAALTEHPAVREAAVISFEDGDGFTKPKAFVVLREGHAPSDPLLREFDAAVKPLGAYKIPAAYEFLPELPRTTLLKIDRRALRERSAPAKR